QRQVVDAGALERDRALQPRRVDGNAGRRGDHRLARLRPGGRLAGYLRPTRCGGRGRRPWGGGRTRGGLAPPGLARCGPARRRLVLRLLLQLLLLALFLELRQAKEILPGDEYEARQQDRQKGVLLIVHWRFSLVLGVTPVVCRPRSRACRRASDCSRSP